MLHLKRRGYECRRVSLVERWVRIVVVVEGHERWGDSHIIENVSALKSFVVYIALEMCLR